MFRNLYKQIDHSKWLADALQNLSSGLAQRRGLPLLIAIGLAILSLIVHLVLAFVPNSVILSILAFVLLHAAILVGLIGVLLSEPVGRG
jgi:uncharacterized membrane protein